MEIVYFVALMHSKKDMSSLGIFIILRTSWVEVEFYYIQPLFWIIITQSIQSSVAFKFESVDWSTTPQAKNNWIVSRLT